MPVRSGSPRAELLIEPDRNRAKPAAVAIPITQYVEQPQGHGATICVMLIAVRIASPDMFPEAEMLPHLICSRPMFIGGAKDEADKHGGA